MISVILPTLNEMRHGYLERVLTAIQSQVGTYELIVVDSASTDGTQDCCEAVADVVIDAGKCNRAQRMNKGAQAARGDILLFHHPRSILPPGALLEIEECLKDPSIAGGGFRHRFDDDQHWLLKYTSWYNNTIQPYKGVMYLDHCLFVRRSVFEDIGGFPNVDIFEDTIFPRAVRKRGRLVLLDSAITTSTTRYKSRGIIKHGLTNQLLKMGFCMGIHPNRLNQWYEGKNPFNVH